MKKFLLYGFILAAMIMTAKTALAFDSKSIVLNDVPYATFMKGTFDNLVLDFSVITVKPDTLKAISLKNLGSANYLSQMKYLELWADEGAPGFQGMGIDREIGDFNSSADQQSWYLDNLSEQIQDTKRFFVTVETFSSVQKSATIQLQIPQLVDNNANGSFDYGDQGIFMDSGNNGPTNAAITNSNLQVFSDYNYDNLSPVIILSNLAAGDLVNTGNFKLQGKIRDQGNSSISSFKITINDQAFDITDIDATNYTWSFDWQNIIDGNYTLSLQAYDSQSNVGEIAPFQVMARKQIFNPANSIVVLDKLTVLANGLDKAVATISLKDENGFPLINWPIQVLGDADLLITSANFTTDHNGQVFVEIRSSAPGVKNFSILVNGQNFKTLSLKASNLDLAKLGINYGDLIKADSPAVYYLGADGKRYVFPTQNVYLSWYKDFSTVKIMSAQDLSLLTIGGNVTYRPGVKMIKIETDPKVYAVDSYGTLRWLKNEAVAKALYGSNWSSKVDDVPDAFFTNYQMGTTIENTSDFNPQIALENAISINADKKLK